MNLGLLLTLISDADAADDEADHALLGLLDLVALPPVPSLQLKVGHPGGRRQCHQDEMTNEREPGGILPVVRLNILLVVHSAHVHVVRCDDHLLQGHCCHQPQEILTLFG